MAAVGWINSLRLIKPRSKEITKASAFFFSIVVKSLNFILKGKPLKGFKQRSHVI